MYVSGMGECAFVDCQTFLATSVVMGVGFTSPIDTPTLYEVHHSEGYLLGYILIPDLQVLFLHYLNSSGNFSYCKLAGFFHEKIFSFLGIERTSISIHTCTSLC
jgi:hypothetical protein